MKDYKVIYFYTSGLTAYYITETEDDLRQIDKRELNKPENKFHAFGLLEDYESSHEQLIKFRTDMKKYTDEIKSVPLKTKKTKKYYRIDYEKYFSHNNAVLQFFLNHTVDNIMSIFEPVNKDEFFIFERCLNSGLITLNLDYKNKPTQCYGYDYSRYYTNLLTTMKIPSKAGIKQKLSTCDMGHLKFGIYRIKITYTNNKFTNIFNFSKLHHYTSSTLNYLHTVKDDYGLSFELLQDDEYDYNTLIYNEKDLIDGKKIFTWWFDALETIRKQCPKNVLVKKLMSTLWGTLTSFKNVYTKNLNDYDATHTTNKKESEYKILDHLVDDALKMVKSADAYKYPMARIKPFLTAFARLRIMKTIKSENLEDNVIRIHTDNIILNREHDFTHLSYYPKPEDKTTGLIRYHNALYGYHICLCNQELKFKEYEKHIKTCDKFICHSC